MWGVFSSSSSCSRLCSSINKIIHPQNPPPFSSFIIFNRLSSPNSISNLQSPIQLLTRRTQLLLLSTISILPSTSPIWAAAAETEELQRYTDTIHGFTLLIPKSWIKVEKAGATLLFEDPSKGSNNVGVVVTPVRLNSLPEFGDPQFVSNKLIQAEKRKESTKDVEIVSYRERPSQNGNDIQVYEFEYNVDSTRGGLKKIFSAAFVSSKKLYLLNIAHSQQPPLSNSKTMLLEQVLHSFDVIPSSSTNT